MTFIPGTQPGYNIVLGFSREVVDEEHAPGLYSDTFTVMPSFIDTSSQDRIAKTQELLDILVDALAASGWTGGCSISMLDGTITPTP